jgi:hypothetical protein
MGLLVITNVLEKIFDRSQMSSIKRRSHGNIGISDLVARSIMWMLGFSPIDSTFRSLKKGVRGCLESIF